MAVPRSWWVRLTGTSAPAATVLIRLFVGAMFLPEGIQKFVYPTGWEPAGSTRSASQHRGSSPPWTGWARSSAGSRSWPGS